MNDSRARGRIDDPHYASAGIEVIDDPAARRREARGDEPRLGHARDLLGQPHRVLSDDGLAELITWSRAAERAATHFDRAERALAAHGLVR